MPAQADDSAARAGAVYVFNCNHIGVWSQQAYIKASNTDPEDGFGYSVALAADGNTLAVGAIGQSSNGVGINGTQSNNIRNWSGAAYVYTRTASLWSQQAYVKASNTDYLTEFGSVVALSGDGNVLVVGAHFESGKGIAINDDQTVINVSTKVNSGAAYAYWRTGSTWTQRSYIKATNTDTHHEFGGAVALSVDGNTLAVGAMYVDSDKGAVYLY